MASSEDLSSDVSKYSSLGSPHPRNCHVATRDSRATTNECANLSRSEVSVEISTDASNHKAQKAEDVVICVICLELADDECAALPCRHSDFHFSCLGTWLQQSQSCPLCKTEVLSVRYRDRNSRSISIYHLPAPDEVQISRKRQNHRGPPLYSHHRPPRGVQGSSETDPDPPGLRFRRQIYERGLYSLYVGNNRISRYRNITPALFSSDPTLVSRAKKWIRRELSALDPFYQEVSLPPAVRTSQAREFRNNEFLLEYVVAILKHIDLKGSAGQAEILLSEHLGRMNARLFLHELENWLRSPFESLEAWDAFIQYPMSNTA